jgi:hypothetical protein
MGSEDGAMTDEREEGRSRWVGWVLCLVAVPVIYVLSLPPLFWGMVYDRGGPHGELPKWFEMYAMPGLWLYDKSSLLQNYAGWWAKRWEPGIGP